MENRRTQTICLTLMPDTPLPSAAPGAADHRLAPGEDDRERIAAVLSARFAEDALSLEEFESRVERVYPAATRRELDALVTDLVPAAPEAPRNAITTADNVPARDRRFAILANLEHHSMALAPRRLDVSAIFGNVELDLRDATFGAGESEIHVRSVFGNIAITLPAGATVEQQASSIRGSIECRSSPARAGRSSGPVVRITGHAVLGAVEILFAERGSRPTGGRGGAPPRLDRGRPVP